MEKVTVRLGAVVTIGDGSRQACASRPSDAFDSRAFGNASHLLAGLNVGTPNLG